MRQRGRRCDFWQEQDEQFKRSEFFHIGRKKEIEKCRWEQKTNCKKMGLDTQGKQRETGARHRPRCQILLLHCISRVLIPKVVEERAARRTRIQIAEMLVRLRLLSRKYEGPDK